MKDLSKAVQVSNLILHRQDACATLDSEELPLIKLSRVRGCLKTYLGFCCERNRLI